MKTIKYSVIKTAKQYKEYCSILMNLASKKPSNEIESEMELIEVLIDKWEKDNFKSKNLDPIALLKYLMENRKIGRDDLITILEINKSAVSQILNYKKGLSKMVIRKLSDYFKVSQEAFNRSYPLVSDANRGHKDEKMMNTKKELVHA